MGGLYHDRWSCSKCDFKDVTVRGPFRVEPSDGTPLAIIEYRWCNSCNSIRRTFTGKGGKYFPGDVTSFFSLLKIQEN